MKRFEYKAIDGGNSATVHPKDLTPTVLEKKLNEPGSDGWELVSTVVVSADFGGFSRVALLLKREMVH